MEWYIIVGIVILYLVIGCIVCIAIDELSTHIFGEEEFIAILLFYPVIGIITGALGVVKLTLIMVNSFKKVINEIMRYEDEK